MQIQHHTYHLFGSKSVTSPSPVLFETILGWNNTAPDNFTLKNAIWMQKDYKRNFIFDIFRGTYHCTTVCSYLLSGFLLLIFAGVAAERNIAQKLVLQWATLGWNNANRLCLTLLQSHLPWTILHYCEETHLSQAHQTHVKQSSELLIDFMRNS